MPTGPRPQTAVVGADPGDVQALERACAVTDAGLILVEAPDTALGFEVAATVARADAAGPAGSATADPDLDVHLAAPTAARWAVAEVEDLILRPARTKPLRRGHVVVADAHAMTGLAADRLLKALEEPRTDVLFWFVVPDASQVRPTLASRAARLVKVRPTPEDGRVAALVAAGFGDGPARAASASAGPDTRLAAAALSSGRLAELQRYADLPTALITTSTPTTTAQTGVADICTLAAALTGQRVTEWEKLAPRGRAEARRLVLHVVGMVRAGLVDALEAHPGAAPLNRAVIGATACDAAVTGIELGAPLWMVLAALGSRLTD